MRSKKWMIPGIATVLFIMVAFGAYKAFDYYKTLKDYRERISTMTIKNVDLSKVPDGEYKGSSEAIWVAADVKVTVKDHKIVRVDLIKHKNERGQSAESIPQKVVEAQSLDVDIVSGATSSSKVILKAIENALNSTAN